ncbi:MAG TPA: YjbQ family protein, partial [Pseudolabrys sp.]|nr:YjbQ family protein [Pseudolabrys sp.]
MPGRLSAIVEAAPELIASATLRTDTRGNGFIDITADAAGFIDSIGASEGVLLIFLRHTSASLTIQENADPDVQADLLTALDRLAPENANWIH